MTREAASSFARADVRLSQLVDDMADRVSSCLSFPGGGRLSVTERFTAGCNVESRLSKSTKTRMPEASGVDLHAAADSAQMHAASSLLL